MGDCLGDTLLACLFVCLHACLMPAEPPPPCICLSVCLYWFLFKSVCVLSFRCLSSMLRHLCPRLVPIVYFTLYEHLRVVCPSAVLPSPYFYTSSTPHWPARYSLLASLLGVDLLHDHKLHPCLCLPCLLSVIDVTAPPTLRQTIIILASSSLLLKSVTPLVAFLVSSLSLKYSLS